MRPRCVTTLLSCRVMTLHTQDAASTGSKQVLKTELATPTDRSLDAINSQHDWPVVECDVMTSVGGWSARGCAHSRLRHATGPFGTWAIQTDASARCLPTRANSISSQTEYSSDCIQQDLTEETPRSEHWVSEAAWHRIAWRAFDTGRWRRRRRTYVGKISICNQQFRRQMAAISQYSITAGAASRCAFSTLLTIDYDFAERLASVGRNRSMPIRRNRLIIRDNSFDGQTRVRHPYTGFVKICFGRRFDRVGAGDGFRIWRRTSAMHDLLDWRKMTRQFLSRYCAAKNVTNVMMLSNWQDLANCCLDLQNWLDLTKLSRPTKLILIILYLPHVLWQWIFLGCVP